MVLHRIFPLKFHCNHCYSFILAKMSLVSTWTEFLDLPAKTGTTDSPSANAKIHILCPNFEIQFQQIAFRMILVYKSHVLLLLRMYYTTEKVFTRQLIKWAWYLLFLVSREMYFPMTLSFFLEYLLNRWLVDLFSLLSSLYLSLCFKKVFEGFYWSCFTSRIELQRDLIS